MAFSESSSTSSVGKSQGKINFDTAGSSVYRTYTKVAKQYKIICVGESMVGKTSLI